MCNLRGWCMCGCKHCGGTGRVRDKSFARTDPEFGWDRCPLCNGTGVRASDEK